MVKRRELKGKATTYIALKIPTELYEFFRLKAFSEKKTLSLVLEEALESFYKIQKEKNK